MLPKSEVKRKADSVVSSISECISRHVNNQYKLYLGFTVTIRHSLIWLAANVHWQGELFNCSLA